MGQNDGGIKRGDRADTGDNEARPNDGTGTGGSGVAGGDTDASVGHPTGDTSALAESMGEAGGESDVESIGMDDSGGIEDLTIHSADDPNLGLTGTPDHPDSDWAANTGPTRVP